MATNQRTTGALIAGVTLNSRYSIVEMIGKGSFGAVYKARDERFQSKPVVAIKEMSNFQLSSAENARALQNFRNEADLLAQLKHPNLPNVTDVFEEDERAYLVMEFIEGKTLAEVLNEQNGPLDERLVMSWALQLCAVLHYLHTQPQPVIFRDMKPTNVMVTTDGVIKLIDFGIARIFKDTAKKDTDVLGTHGYAPLEQYGRGQSDARSDIYALGATLYELLTEKPPVDAPTRRINPWKFSSPCQSNPNLSPAIGAIVLKAMEEQPQDRYQTAADMYSTIAATAPESTSNTPLPTSGPFAALPTSQAASGPTSYPTTPPALVPPHVNTIPRTSDHPQLLIEGVTNTGDQGIQTDDAQSSQPSSAQVAAPPNPPVSPPESGRTLEPRRKFFFAIVSTVVIFGLVLSSIIFFAFKPNSPAALTTFCLATDLPTSGPVGPTGRDMRNAVDLALIQSPLTKGYHGYEIKAYHMDDASPENSGSPDPATGARNIQGLFQQTTCSNPIAIIGPYDSSVAAAEIPIAAQKDILLFSTSNTAPCLTQKEFSDPASCNYDSIHPQGLSNTYARTAGDDTVRGYLIADFLVAPPNPNNLGQSGLGAKKIVIVGDEAIASTQISRIVIEALRNRGVTPIGTYCIKPTEEYNKDHSCSLNPSTDAFSIDNAADLAAKIRDQQPDAIFFGERPDRGAGILRKYLGELGLDQIPFVGSGSFVTIKDTFLQTMGSHAGNVYAIVIGADPSTFTAGAAAAFSKEYQNEFGKPPGTLSPGSYDAANIILQVIKARIDAGQPITRESVTQGVLSGNFTGVVGNSIRFDQNGDNIGERVYTLYQTQQSQGLWDFKGLTQLVG